MARRDVVSGLFGLKGDAWMRHANPASVWTRFAVLPLLVLAIWARTWIGWWCLIPVALLIVWLMINPLFFERPSTTRHWASRSVFGERIWVERERASLPASFRSSVPAIAQAAQILGLAGLVYGLWTFDPAATLGGLVVVELGKCWYLDRMVLLFDTLKVTDPDIAAWEY